ncbi:efflux RND transporter periplasmic adaptor subunit [uncultured Algimonas sp.]|uniref:efflux RND transporter periplasmic adaptor subunit n=1 Tax=uncultured Algimonas sp. TaxID=1547920 RepID=UPI00263181E7|nr:efflux RND transporter periplasmic adaptor subunit [uncultured Algimonas sp.]
MDSTLIDPISVNPESLKSSARTKVRLWIATLLTVLVLVTAALASWWLLGSAPAPQTDPAPIPAPLVETVPISHGEEPISVTGFGTIIPAREVSISPQVEGVVIEISDNLEPGGLVREDEMLFRIDPQDMELEVTQAEALVAQAEYELTREVSEAETARQDFQDLFPDRQDENISPLARREPQTRRAQANLAAAMSRLAEARLALSRTVVRAPFDAAIVDEDLDVGGRVDPAMTPLRLVGDREFWIMASTPLADLRRLSDAQDRSVVVTINPGTATPSVREGRFVRTLPSVDPEGRLGRILVSVEDPLGYRTEAVALTLGGYARVDVDAGSLENAMLVPREAVRENNVVWVRDGRGQLQFRDADILWHGHDTVIARIDHLPGETLIVSYLDNPLPGQSIRVRDEPAYG